MFWPRALERRFASTVQDIDFTTNFKITEGVIH